MIVKSIAKGLTEVWSPTSFDNQDMLGYAMPRITSESQQGVAALSLAALIFLGSASVLAVVFHFGSMHVYTYSMLALLSLHINISSRSKLDLTSLYLLAIALLVICGSSMVLVAQKAGSVDAMMLSSVAALFMLVPVVPWGLREALAVVCAIYFMFTASMASTGARFTLQEFWMMQFLMLFAAFVSLVLVTRSVILRKSDLRLQFNLLHAHAELQELLERDPLTGAWNRRFLGKRFSSIVGMHHAGRKNSYFVLLDIDQFKTINDTFGHHVGDRVLQAIVNTFTDLSGKNEYVVRLGGDEFALLLCEDSPEERVQMGQLRLQEMCAGSGGQPFPYPHVSVGYVCITPKRLYALEDVYKMADDAQYQAKRAGGARIVEHGQPSSSVTAFEDLPQAVQ